MLRVNWITNLQAHMFLLLESHFFLTQCGKCKLSFQVHNAKFKAKLVVLIFIFENKVKHAEINRY